MSSFVQIGETSSVSRFLISAPDVAVRWKKWLRSFEIFLTARGVVNAIQQNALLLNIAGEEIMDLVDTFPDDRLVATDTSNVYGVLVKALNEHFRPLVNVPFERSIFRRADCSEEETVDVYATRLRKLAKSCEYGDNLDDIIRDQIIEKVHSQHLRRKFLERGSSLTLSTLLDISRTYESVEVQNSRMSAAISSSSFNAIRKTGTRDLSTLQSVMCYRCGYKGHSSTDRSCPAWKKTCAKCGENDHFAKAKFCNGVSANFQSSTSGRRVWKNAVSRRDAVREVYSDDEEGALFHVGPAHGPTAVVTLSTKDKSVDIPVIIDSGASDNVMDWITYSGIVKENLDVKLSLSSKGLFDVSNNRLPLEGEFVVNVSFTDSAVSDSKFYVCKNVSYTLLSYETARALSMIKISENVREVKYDALQDKSRVLFEGMGKLTDCVIELHVDESVIPICQPCRRIPFGYRKKVAEKLKELESLDIIEKVEGVRTSWLSPLVALPKDNGDLRICVDMRRANAAILRECHHIPTVKEVLYHLNGSTHFSKLDFVWDKQKVRAFEAIKDKIGDCDTLAYFDPNAPTTLVADASPCALGSVLTPLQGGTDRVIAYAHRSLSDIERRYSQTEREALSLVWACEHFQMYLLGTEFTLITDHKPLEFIFHRMNSKPPPRMERWALRLLPFQYSVVYQPGKSNIADVCSRLEGWESWKEKDTLNKFKMKEYSDERKGTKVHDVKVGNRVLVKVNKKQNKLTPEFERKPYEVTRVKGGEVECMNESRKIRRNESQLKKLNESIVESLNEDVQAGEDKSEQLEERSRASESINNSLEEKDMLKPKASLRKSTRESKFPSKFKDFVT